MSFVGTTAPGFRLANEDNQWMTLGEFLEKGPLMLVFYPGDFTPVCTKQLCAYQKSFEQFMELGLQIAGISKNSPSEHKKFKDQYSFRFPLLSDPNKSMTRAWGVTSLFMLGGTSRAVFIVNTKGVVVYRYVEPTVITHRSSEELLQIIRKLKAQHSI